MTYLLPLLDRIAALLRRDHAEFANTVSSENGKPITEARAEVHKLGPALAGGNAVVHKPSEQTPLSALMLAHVVQEALLHMKGHARDTRRQPRCSFHHVQPSAPALDGNQRGLLAYK